MLNSLLEVRLLEHRVAKHLLVRLRREACKGLPLLGRLEVELGVVHDFLPQHGLGAVRVVKVDGPAPKARCPVPQLSYAC